MDKRKIELKRLQKKMNIIQDKYSFDLDNIELLTDITKFNEYSRKHFHLKFDIEHCNKCYQILPQYNK